MLFHINIITHLNHSVSSVLQATRYCEPIGRITIPCLKKCNVEMVVFSPKVQCFYFCGTLVMVIIVPSVYAIL